MYKFLATLVLVAAACTPFISYAALTDIQTQSILSLLSSFGADTSVIQNVQQSLSGTVLGVSIACPALTTSLQRGMSDATTGGQVTALQKFLAAYYGLNEQDIVTGYFGVVTLRTAIRFQTEQGISPIGTVGAQTRARIALLCGGAVTTTLTPKPVLCPAIVPTPIECLNGDLTPRFDANSCQNGWICTPVATTTRSVTVSLDTSSPGFQLVPGGSTNVVTGAFKFHSVGEGIVLNKLTVFSATYSGDVARVSVYDGVVKVGEGFFLGGAPSVAVSFTQAVLVPTGVDKVLTVKADFSAIGTGEIVSQSGHSIQLNVSSASGTGVTSGSAITSTGNVLVSGVQVMKSIPAVSLDTVPLGAGLADGRLMRFKITADAHGPVGLTQLFLAVTPTGAQVSNVNIYGFSDASYSTPVSGVSQNGALRSTNGCPTGCSSNPIVNIGITTANGTPTEIQIPAGSTRYFEVRGTVTGMQPGASVNTRLAGDAAYTAPVSAVSLVGKDAYFIWSPNSTTTARRADQDWFTGYGVAGLSESGISYTRTGGVTTPMPLPVITTYTASPTVMSPGQSATLMWSTTGTTDGGCHIYLGSSGTNVNTTGLPGSGSFTVTPSATTAYRLWCTNSWKDGSQFTEKTITVTVQSVIPLPPVVACPLIIYTPVSCSGTTLPTYDANGCLAGVTCQPAQVDSGTVRQSGKGGTLGQ